MKMKMLALVALLGLTAFASLSPRAEAINPYCGAPFCGTKPASTVCYCSPTSENPGWGTTCGMWKVVCAGR
jgi:hypothetical protein